MRDDGLLMATASGSVADQWVTQGHDPYAGLTEQSAAGTAATADASITEQWAAIGPPAYGALVDQSAGYSAPPPARIPDAFAASGSQSWTPVCLYFSQGDGEWH
jgi:hypothetical protein